MNKEALDSAFWTYCKATGLNPESHPVVEEAVRQAIEAYLEHANKHPAIIQGENLIQELHEQMHPTQKPENL